jgi:hypothetical protein
MNTALRSDPSFTVVPSDAYSSMPPMENAT